jgi:uncharacterized protein (TIGR02646 family)
MISIARIRTEKAIPLKFRGNAKHLIDRELLLARRQALLVSPEAKIEWNSGYWKSAKKQLKVESRGKCAYCEASTDVVAHGDVEHYRPKSVYWWLAYTYDNYLYACQICNQKYKGDKFPTQTAGAYLEPAILPTSTDAELDALVGLISPDPLSVDSDAVLSKYLAGHLAERPYLLNPYLDDPASYFAYEADDTTEYVTLVPLLPEYQQYVTDTEECYGLNRVELKSLRYQTYRMFRAFKMAAIQLTDPATKKEILKQIEKMKKPNYIFSGMINYFDSKI